MGMVDDGRLRTLGVKLCVPLAAIVCFSACFCPYNTCLCRALSLMPLLSLRGDPSSITFCGQPCRNSGPRGSRWRQVKLLPSSSWPAALLQPPPLCKINISSNPSVLQDQVQAHLSTQSTCWLLVHQRRALQQI